jgi:hypothetical protein
LVQVPEFKVRAIIRYRQNGWNGFACVLETSEEWDEDC